MHQKGGGEWILKGSERLISIKNIEFSPITFVYQKISSNPKYSVGKYLLEAENQINPSLVIPMESEYLSENNMNNPLWIDEEKAYIEPEKKNKEEKSEIQPTQPPQKKRKTCLIMLIVVIVLLFLCCAGYYIVDIFLRTSTNGTSSGSISSDLIFQNIKAEKILTFKL